MGRPKKDKSFDNLRATLKELKRAQRAEREHKSRRTYRQAQRATGIPADRRCPDCGKIKLKSKQWVMQDGIVTCLSCWRKYYA